MIKFERGGNIMERVGVGVKKDMPKISKISARLGRVREFHPSGLSYKSMPIRELEVTGNRGSKTIKKLNKLTERSKLEYILEKRVIKGVSRLSIQSIFNFSAGELQDGDYIRIMYHIAEEDRDKGPQSEGVSAIGGGKIVWKPTGEIVEIMVGEIYMMKKDFWFNLLGFDYD